MVLAVSPFLNLLPYTGDGLARRKRGPNVVVTMPYLSDNDRTRLRTDFVVPLIIGQMFAGLEPLDDVAEYTIHDIVGDLKPDCGLLCVALCAAEIASHYESLPVAGILALESERIINEFGRLWLRDKIDAAEIRQSLVHIPEDLEVLADLLDATQAEITDTDITARTLCDMMALQARFHAESAEEELQRIKLAPLPRQAVETGKVIPFPVRP